MKQLLEYFATPELTERQERDYTVLRFAFLKADEATANKRRYPLSVLSKAIEEAQRDVRRGAIFGSSSHKPQLELDDVSHVITALEMADKMAICEAKILSTQRGKNLQIILRHGRLGVSARGTGSVKLEKGEEIVQDDYRILGVDFTTSPASGMTAGAESIVESVGAAVVFNSAEILDEEKILDKKFQLARSAGYKGDWETFCLYERNKDVIGIFNFASKCGFKGSFEGFLKSRRK